MLAEAHRRIAADPTRYQPVVYGEHEVGGTSVLYVSDIPLDFLAWGPELGPDPLPQLTASALGKVPPTILLVGGVMTGIYWVIGRRMRLAAAAASAAPSGEAPPARSDEPGGRNDP
jgi:formate dehydrogenase iron-sulfur subunit